MRHLLPFLFFLVAGTWLRMADAQPNGAPAPLAFPTAEEWKTIEEDGRTTRVRYAPWKTKGEDVSLLRETLRNGIRHGPYERRFPDNRLAEKGQYTDGLREGAWEFHTYFPSCVEQGDYRNGMRIGLWRTRCHGITVAEGFYIGGHATVWRYTADAKRLAAVETWKNERRHGPYRRFDDEGRLVQWGDFVEGKPNGLWREYANGIRLSETEYLRGERHGSHREWFATGSLREQGQYVEGKRQGVHRSFWEGGALHCRGDFLLGSGTEDCYWPNGEKQEIRSFLNGRPDGLHQRFSRMGKELLRETFRDGILDGERTHHDEKGVLLDRHVFANGTGHFLERDEDGARVLEGELVSGLRHGSWKEFRKRGQVPVRWMTYEHGVLHGPAREPFGDTDRVWEGTYEHGERTGEWMVRAEDNRRLGVLRMLRGDAAGTLVSENGTQEAWRIFLLPRSDVRRALRVAGISLNDPSETERTIRLVQTDGAGEQPARMQKELYGGLGYDVTQFDQAGHEAYRFAHLLRKNWGTWRWFYEDGSVEKEGFFVAGQLARPMLRYTPHSGRLLQWGPHGRDPGRQFDEQGFQRMSRWPEGDSWRVARYDRDGGLMKTGLLRDGQKVGTWTGHENGQTTTETTFQKGTGLQRRFSASGVLLAQGTVGGLPDNPFLADNFLESPKEGVWRFHSDGALWQVEAGFRENRLDGLWSLFDQGGKLRISVEMKDGLRNGKGVLWREDGLPLLVKHFRNGQAHGPIRIHDERGTLLGVGAYRDGVMSGEWFYEDPRLGLRSEAILGTGDGFLLENYPNGTLATHGRIEGNTVQGPLAMFTPEDVPLVQGRVGSGERLTVRFEKLPTPHPKVEKLLARLFGPILAMLKPDADSPTETPPPEWLWLTLGESPFELSGPCLAHEALPFEFVSCLPDGLWILHDAQGNALAEWNYDQGEGVGIWRWFLPNGRLMTQRRFMNEAEPPKEMDPFRVFPPEEP